jgi:cytochrome oxidase assembly protein ShyY1
MNRFRRPSALAWLLLLSGLAVFIAAGVWQHGRAETKRARLAAWQALADAPALAMAPAQAARADGFDRVQVRGRWLPPRYLLDGQVREGRVGVEAYAPLATAAGPVLLVALEWLPYASPGAPPPVPAALPDGEVVLTGTLAPPPAHGLRLGRDWSSAPGWPKLMPYFDLAQIAGDSALALAPRVLRPDPGPGPPAGRPWRPVEGMPPERHLAYAWQWWSLALAIVIVFLVVHRPRRSPP